MCVCVCVYMIDFRFFSILGYYKTLNIVPCAIQEVLVKMKILKKLHSSPTESDTLDWGSSNLCFNTFYR